MQFLVLMETFAAAAKQCDRLHQSFSAVLVAAQEASARQRAIKCYVVITVNISVGSGKNEGGPCRKSARITTCMLQKVVL